MEQRRERGDLIASYRQMEGLEKLDRNVMINVAYKRHTRTRKEAKKKIKKNLKTRQQIE